MDPKKEQIVKLAAKWEQRTISQEEELELNAWYQDHQDEQINLPADFVISETIHEKRIWNKIERQIGRQASIRQLFNHTWPRIAIVAAAVALIVLGYFFNYINRENLKQFQDNVALNDVAPGQVGATLTLANGKKIRLTDAANGEIAKEAGMRVTKTVDGQLVYEIASPSESPTNDGIQGKMNTLSTAKGETYALTLPDKSKVWLNAASSLTYSANLVQNGQRRVKLTGEAYLEVAKDKEHPFIVATDKQEVEVLGTHFNVNAYSNEPSTATTLLEGSVKVTSGNMKQVLKPGEQALNIGTAIQISPANLTEATAWKDGDFQFSEEKMSSIMRKLERWYDVDIELSDKLANEEFSGNISRSRNISRVLRMMEKTNSIHFKIEGRRIIAIEK